MEDENLLDSSEDILAENSFTTTTPNSFSKSIINKLGISSQRVPETATNTPTIADIICIALLIIDS